MSVEPNTIIAIDGPAASGKSTVARKLARRLGLRYLDSGAMYRALTWKALDVGADLSDENALVELMRKTQITLEGSPDSMKVCVDGRDVTEEIRSKRVTDHVYHIASCARLRPEFQKLQREWADDGGVIAEGRDIGSVVFPNANRKFFLDASPAERAHRRHKEMAARGEAVPIAKLQHDIEERDKRDTSRDFSPLVQCQEAVYVDTTGLSIDEVVALIQSKIEGCS